MTTKQLIGTYSSGYTLSAVYSAVNVTSKASVTGFQPSSGYSQGGVGLLMPQSATLTNAGAVRGGKGSYAYYQAHRLLPGGVGGIGVETTAGSIVHNDLGLIAGGAGGDGGDHQSGGDGGDGILLGPGGSVGNTRGSVILGGNGGLGGYSFTGGLGGTAVDTAGGALSNDRGQIAGGYGGSAEGAVRAADRFGSGGDGGTGVIMRTAGSIQNSRGTIAGGAGGRNDYYGTPGAGGVAIILLSGGTIVNTNGGAVAGGRGGSNPAGESAGAKGGAGVVLYSGGALINNAASSISGGQGGGNGLYVDGGAGGAGVILETSGSVINGGTVNGGDGGDDAALNDPTTGSSTGVGGAGVILKAGGVVTNNGRIMGGGGGRVAVGGYGFGGSGGAGVSFLGSGTLNNYGGVIGGTGHLGGHTSHSGSGGQGVLLGGTGFTINNAGSIVGGAAYYHSLDTASLGDGIDAMRGGLIVNGGSTNATAIISGAIGIADGSYAGGLTVVNYGSIVGRDFNGQSGVSVFFQNASDLLVAHSGAVFVKSVVGGGGTIELAGGSGSVTGLGAGASLTGAVTGSLSGFGTYAIDTGGKWTLNGTNVLGSAQTMTLAAGAGLAVAGSLESSGNLQIGGTVSGPGKLLQSGGTAIVSSGAVVGVAGWTMSAGSAVIAGALTYKGAFSEGAGATVTVIKGAALSLTGAVTLGGVLNGDGSAQAANATLSSLTVGGSLLLTLTGNAVQNGKIQIGDAGAASAGLIIAKGAIYTINGAFGIGRGAATGSSLTVVGTFIRSGAAGLSTVGVAIVDSGLIEAASGTLDFTQKVTGKGVFNIDAGATLEFDSSVAKTLTVGFNGAGAVLALKKTAKLAGAVSGLAVGNSIDLLKQAATGASVNASNQLVIVNGATTVTTLQLAGSYAGAVFSVGSDGAGGTLVKLLATNAAPPAPHGFIAAMAGLVSSAGGGGIQTTAPSAGEADLRLASPVTHG